jgi:hypothetical protein
MYKCTPFNISSELSRQGCQMVYFDTNKNNFGIFWNAPPGLPDGIKNTFGIFWKALEWKMLVHFRVIWYFYGPFMADRYVL